MISSLKGILTHKTPTEIVIDCNGVGYQVFLTLTTYEVLPELNSEVFIHTCLLPKEDAFYLYGFSDENEREAFKLLLTVNGIGPKIAIGILSSLDISGLRTHLISNNTEALQKLPGIGKKTAERLVLELKDKITKLDIGDSYKTESGSDSIRHEAVLALVALGFSSQAAEKAVRNLTGSTNSQMTVEDIIRQVLNQSGK